MDERPEAVLVVEQGAGDPSLFTLDKPQVLLGKMTEADVVIENPYVSRRHAEIRHDGEGFLIRDLASKNGTFVNGVPVAAEGCSLRPGDRIELAQGQVVLRFELAQGTITLPAYAPASQASLEVDSRSREVAIHGRKVEPPLSRKEFDILSFLYEHRGEACSKDAIARQGWPDRDVGDVSDQEIEQCIRRLRRRIEPAPSRPQYVVTVRGFGYKLNHE